MGVAMVLNPGGKRRYRRRRKNAWKGDKAGHCRAAKKGWRKRRRRKARRSKSSRAAAARKGHRRRRRKARLYQRFAGVPAKRRRRRKRRANASNPRRRRRRRRNYSHWIPAYKNPRRKARRRHRYNYKAKRRRKRNYSHWIPAYKNPQWIPNYAVNPGRGLMGSLTAGFSPKTIMSTVPWIGGAVGNAALQSAVSGFLPDMLQEGPGSYVTGLATAGLLGAGVGMVSPRHAAPVFMGGVVEQLLKAFGEYVAPAVGLSGCCGLGFDERSYSNLEWGNPLVESQPLITKSYLPSFQKVTDLNPWARVPGMGDYLTRANAAEARPLGDYLTRANAAEARPLGAYTYSDIPMEEAQVAELSVM